MKHILLLFSLSIFTLMASADIGSPYTMQSTSAMMSSIGSSQISNGGFSNYGQPFDIGATSPTTQYASQDFAWEEEGDDPVDWDNPNTPVGTPVWGLLLFAVAYSIALAIRKSKPLSNTDNK